MSPRMLVSPRGEKISYRIVATIAVNDRALRVSLVASNASVKAEGVCCGGIALVIAFISSSSWELSPWDMNGPNNLTESMSSY